MSFVISPRAFFFFFFKDHRKSSWGCPLLSLLGGSESSIQLVPVVALMTGVIPTEYLSLPFQNQFREEEEEV